ncbi:TNF receptor-associated factor 6-like isoform X1 [Amblyomma americanum]
MLYTLVGFSPELDWRPLLFAKPIPQHRVCGACGLVRKKTAFLPCMHVLCESCYGQCAQEGSRICPLDGCDFQDEDVERRECPAEEVLRREVKCWNAKHGCGTVVAASLLPEHFQRECRHHFARCPKCSASVLCSDVCAHLRLDCATPSTPLAPESGHHLNDTEDTALSTSFQRVIEQQAVEMRTHIRELVTDIKLHGDRLNEISHGVNTSKEALTGKLTQATIQIQESMKTGVREIASDNGQLKEHLITRNDNISSSLKALEEKMKDELVAATRQSNDNCSRILASFHEMKVETVNKCEETLLRIQKLLPRDEPQGEHVIFDVKGVKSLEEKALKKGWAAYETCQVYLRGYCMSPGVTFIRDSQSVDLHVRMLLHKGDNDDAVEWPFQHKIRLKVIHPRESVWPCFVEIKPRRESENVQKPKTSSNKAFCLALPSFNLRALRNCGCVFEDTLRFKWEVLP